MQTAAGNVREAPAAVLASEARICAKKPEKHREKRNDRKKKCKKD